MPVNDFPYKDELIFLKQREAGKGLWVQQEELGAAQHLRPGVNGKGDKAHREDQLRGPGPS